MKAMSHKITLDLPEESFSALRQNPDDFAKELLHAALSKWYEQGLISQSKASEIARLSRQEFLDVLKKYNVSPFQYTPEDLEKEIQ
jgi:predicted HTH domain antitoxin